MRRFPVLLVFLGYTFFWECLIIAMSGRGCSLLNPEPGGDQVTLFALDVVQGYVRACASFFFFLCCICSPLFFSAKHFPPSRGCKCGHLSSRVFVVSSSNPLLCRWSAGGFSHDFFLVLAPVFPSISTRARLAIAPFLWLVCRRAFPSPPPPHRRYAAGF